MAKERTLILGAGLTGLSTAWHLKKKNINYQIFEKEDTPGGLCRSKNIGGFIFDYGGHLLHFKHKYTYDLVKGLLNNNLIRHKRNSWVYSFNTYVPYPFQANFFGLSPQIAKDCLLGFIHAANNGHYKKNQDPNFRDWIYQTFGRGIARYFMLPYNKKFWTIPLSEITCDWINSFVPQPSLEEVIENTITRSTKPLGYNANFWYSKKGGIQKLTSAFVERVNKLNLSCCCQRIDIKNKKIFFRNGREEKYDRLISTLPLPELVNIVTDLPENITSSFKKLRWISILNLNLGINREGLSDKHWIYFPEKHFIFFRVGFPHNFSSQAVPPNKSSLYIEISYSRNKLIDKKNIVLRIIKDLIKARIISATHRLLAEDINDIKYGYPIYDYNYRLARRSILKFLQQNNIISCGRYGSWRYMSMEDAILEGKEIAEKL
jgi:UDP-galactopyranose mutase